MGAAVVSRCCEDWCCMAESNTCLGGLEQDGGPLLHPPCPLGCSSSTQRANRRSFKAIRGGKEKDVKRILEENVDSLASFINKQDPPSGQTPLMMAVLMGKEEVVRLLLKEPAVDASIPEKDGYTPFHGAGFQGRANIARMLIKDSRGLDPSDRHKDGFQPIHRACWGGEARHAETVKVLVEEGGVAWDSKGKGKTCLQITQNSKTKAWLREWGKRQQKGTEL